MKIAILWILLTSSLATAAPAGMRSVYLNGIDISSARNQTLNHVDVKVDAKGDLYIVAPQYEVQQETTFVPLGKQALGQTSPLQHKQPSALIRKEATPASDVSDKLASPPETSDTLPQSENAASSEALASPPASKATRTPSDVTQPPSGPGTQVP